MSRFIVKLALGVIAVPVMWAYGVWEKGAVAETYNITEIDQPIFDRCDIEMDARNMMFQDAPAALGCACIAKHATSEYPPSEHAVFIQALDLTIEYMEATVYLDYGDDASFEALDAKFETGAKKIAESAGWGSVKFEKMTDRIWEIEETCGAGGTHKGDSQLRIAALTPIAGSNTVVQITPKPQKTDAEVTAMLR